MKKTIVAFAFIASSFVIVDDILTKTGTNEAAIHKSIVQAALSLPDDNAIPMYSDEKSFASSYKITKAIILNQRGAIVNEMGAYFKKYYTSPQFKKDFSEALKAYQPGDKPKDSAYYQKQYDTAYKRTVAAYDSFKINFNRDKMKSTVNANAGQSNAAIDRAAQMLKDHPELAAKSGMSQEELLAKLQQAQGQLAAGKAQANEKIDENLTDPKIAQAKADADKNYNEALVKLKTDLDNNLQNVPTERQRYNDKVALYKKKSDYKTNIHATLQNFLSATDGIDFTAELKSNKTFANPAYEQKNKLWKACFRAGKEATEAARALAKSW